MRSQETAFYDIYGMWHIPWWQTWVGTALWITVGCAVFAALLGYYLYKKRRQRQRILPWQKAARAIQLLQQQPTLDSREFYYTLTAILKTYLIERYGLVIAGKTDAELVEYLTSTEFPAQLLTFLHQILEGGMTCKFAHAQAQEQQRLQDIALAHTIIEQTIPQNPS